MMTTDVEIEWQLFMSGILEAAAECCALKQLGLPPRGQKQISYWTREVQLTVKEKTALKQGALNSHAVCRSAQSGRPTYIPKRCLVTCWSRISRLQTILHSAFWQTVRRLGDEKKCIL
ncbi:unnamed protein product [Soboliphyme baturini]|uniref:Transposase n=1 Tax=Soboliphyme baturini TaxID=241478 RepID=A0A183IY14_9BILA|nr:unnamed protein product [Soboliphyme baturini]